MKNLVLAAMVGLAAISAPALASDNKKEPVTLINAFIVPDGKAEEAIRFWEKAAAFMKSQPGYISTALHQAILPNAKFQLINVAKWKSIEAYQDASLALRTQSGITPIEGVIPNPSLYNVIRSD